MDNIDIEALRAKLERHEQAHLLRFWEQLDGEKRAALAAQLEVIDFEEVNDYFQRAQESLKGEAQLLDDRMLPLSGEEYVSMVEANEKQLEEYRQEGLERIANGEVGVVLMAGGQGTRLGVSHPKGMYHVGVVSGKSLLELQAERILKVQRMAEERIGRKGRVVWYVMASEATVEETRRYLHDNNYLGLEEEDVFVFVQGKLPCFDTEGRVLMDQKWRVAEAPDGNGGLYRALASSGALEDMGRRGVTCVHVHSVDNILVLPADPVFVGWCWSAGADCAAKCVRKTSADEAVGVVCRVDGRVRVVEYSEITKATSERTRDDDPSRLAFDAGNICNHFFTTEFLKRVAKEHERDLPLHVARKKIPCVGEDGEEVRPSTPNGVKLEKFVFDVFGWARCFLCVEVERATEFSALKNADSSGRDCPSTARADLHRLHKRYVEEAGGIVVGDDVEVAASLSYAGEGLAGIVAGKTYQAPHYIS